MDYTIEFNEIPTEFVTSVLTDFQKESIVIKYVIKKEVSKATCKSEAFRALAKIKINNTSLSRRTIGNLYYEVVKAIKKPSKEEGS